MMKDLEEYVLRLDSLINNLDRLYETKLPEGINAEISHNLLNNLNFLLKQHELLQACLSGKKDGVIASGNTNLISDKIIKSLNFYCNYGYFIFKKFFYIS